MNDGVAMLLERMKTNPEEFLGVRDGKCESLVYRFHEYLDPQDYAIFRQELTKIMQQRFTEQVMEELIAPKKSSLEELITAKRNANPTLLAQQQFQTEMMRSQLDLAKANKLETKNPHKTLFGKLFNYQ